jgi:SAM-dependent methyltransferase
MNHQDHVRLLQKGVVAPGGVWADLGAGDGAFTLALAELLGPGAMIYAVDREGGALRRLASALARQFPATTLHTRVGDFTQPLDLPKLDGLVMANSLHYIPDPGPVVAKLRQLLTAEGRLLVVEYNTDRGNQWVPYAFSFGTWQQISRRAGFVHTELIATQPSRFLGEFFAAASWGSADAETGPAHRSDPGG